MKSLIYLGIIIGSIVGGWLGSLIDHGNIFGLWGFALGTVGSIVGLLVGFRFGQ